jgi:hypothetical protein
MHVFCVFMEFTRQPPHMNKYFLFFIYVYETREMERSMRLSAHGLVVRLYSIYALQVDPSSASNTVDK